MVGSCPPETDVPAARTWEPHAAHTRGHGYWLRPRWCAACTVLAGGPRSRIGSPSQLLEQQQGGAASNLRAVAAPVAQQRCTVAIADHPQRLPRPSSGPDACNPLGHSGCPRSVRSRWVQRPHGGPKQEGRIVGCLHYRGLFRLRCLRRLLIGCRRQSLRHRTPTQHLQMLNCASPRLTATALHTATTAQNLGDERVAEKPTSSHSNKLI